MASVQQKIAWPESIDAAAYHGLAGDVVQIIEPHTEADPVALLVQFLCAFGSITGRKAYYQVEADKHFSNIFTILVGDTSKARKGTSWGHVRGLFACVDDFWAKSCVHSGLSSSEGLIWAVRDPVSDDDVGVGDKRLMVLESEFARVLRVMEREGNTLSQLIRDSWDRGDLATMTKSSPAHATGAHVSIVGHITADELCRYLTRTEGANGFANRFLFMCVQRSKCLPHGGALDDAAMRLFSERLAHTIGEARKIERVTMNAIAHDLWTEVYPTLSEGKPGLLGAVIGRAEAQVIRLALIYALLDASSTITATHLRAALAVWEYAEASAGHIFGNASGDPVADQIHLALLVAGTEGRTKTALRDLFGRHVAATRVDAALGSLQKAGKATSESKPTAGRPVEVWRAING